MSLQEFPKSLFPHAELAKAPDDLNFASAVVVRNPIEERDQRALGYRMRNDPVEQSAKPIRIAPGQEGEAIQIPEDWQKMPWMSMRALAVKLGAPNDAGKQAVIDTITAAYDSAGS